MDWSFIHTSIALCCGATISINSCCNLTQLTAFQVKIHLNFHVDTQCSDVAITVQWVQCSNTTQCNACMNGCSGTLLPQIYKGDPRSWIPSLVMASSAMRLKLGVFRFFPTTHTNKSKTNTSMIIAHHKAFHACLSSCSDHSRCRWHTLLTNHGYFDYRKNPKTPNLSPMLG